MAATPKKPVLTISTFVERDIIRIDDVDYELRSLDEMSIQAIRGHARVMREAAELLSNEQRTARQEKQLEKILKPFLKVLLIAPDAVHDKLDHDRRMAIIEYFSMLRAVETAEKLKAAGATHRKAKAFSKTSNKSRRG